MRDDGVLARRVNVRRTSPYSPSEEEELSRVNPVKRNPRMRGAMAILVTGSMVCEIEVIFSISEM